MADDSGRVSAYCYDPRGVLLLKEFHAPRRLQRWLRANPYRITYNQAFSQVISLCGARRRTWLCPEIEQTFCELHRHGWAHSLEAWQGDQLVGGLYGMALGGTFCGESMFHRAPQASKACLIELYRRMIQGGFDLIDCQDVTPTLAQFGARAIKFKDYYRLFRQYREKDCTLNG
jgi:leucyl/phenylalanyl-tRNA--protein transferase